MAKRIVIDGAPGSGKSTVLAGRSHEDNPHVKYNSMQSRGLQVIPESISAVIDQVRKDGKVPSKNMAEVIERIVQAEIVRYSTQIEGDVAFFDRGLPGYETVAERYGVTLSDSFLSACEALQYDSPIFLFNVVESYDISQPRGTARVRIYTLQERLQRHEQAKQCYERRGYQVHEVPVFSNDVQKSIDKRIDFVLDRIS